MKDEIQVTIKTSINSDGEKTDGKEIKINCPVGTTIESLVSNFGIADSNLAAVRANNETLPLSAKLEVNTFLEPILLESPDGVDIYRCSLAFLLAIAANKLFPKKRLYIGHSLSYSYYYTFLKGKKPAEEEIKKLENMMRELVKEDLPIRTSYMSYADAMERFTKNNQDDTALLLNERSESKIMVNECAEFSDLYISPLVNRTGLITAFELEPYEEGFLLRFPSTANPKKVAPLTNSSTIFSVYSEYKKWGRIIGVHSVGTLNRLISERNIKEYIRIAEAFQEKKLSEIADEIYAKKEDIKTILIAGPSSSGKTTCAKRLSLALKVMGIEPIAIGLDDYYRGTAQTPTDEKGDPDFECLEALDVPYLNEQLLSLLAGNEVTLPAFDFKAGKRKEEGGRKIHLERRNVLIIEGIHGLNDDLTPQIKKEAKFKLYISALTQLNLDDHNRIPTSDNRLLRRMVRDYQFRGAGAKKTIDMWPNVRKGEKKHIFPFQGKADAAFNSALDYELSVLKFYAEPLLRSVKPGMKEYSESSRLLHFLENFAPIPPQYVPGTSILREFIGDSDFKY